ncbi:hypothetical protein SteCoe_16312 [Stentor coeruleus]|uniref:Uncharacterized protein n=1 Tax=Stentor coeruleus TaxID=5963 RepID=A0A1R2C1H8_9CILI|nr:hypothetical protein SteCoe_16312 [Stentor coeruleus]
MDSEYLTCKDASCVVEIMEVYNRKMDSEYLTCKDASCVVVTFQIINYFKTCLNYNVSEQLLDINNFLKAKSQKTQYLIPSSHKFLEVKNHFYHPLNFIKSLSLLGVIVSSNPPHTNIKYTIFIQAINQSDSENFNTLNNSFRNYNLVGILVQNYQGDYEFLYRKGIYWILNSYTNNGFIEENIIKGFSGCILKTLDKSIKALVYHQK